MSDVLLSSVESFKDSWWNSGCCYEEELPFDKLTFADCNEMSTLEI